MGGKKELELQFSNQYSSPKFGRNLSFNILNVSDLQGLIKYSCSVADPGFPRGGAPTDYMTNFSRISPKKCIKMQKFWARVGGARPWRPF